MRKVGLKLQTFKELGPRNNSREQIRRSRSRGSNQSKRGMGLGREVVSGYYRRLGCHMFLKAYFMVRLNLFIFRYLRQTWIEFY